MFLSETLFRYRIKRLYKTFSRNFEKTDTGLQLESKLLSPDLYRGTTRAVARMRQDEAVVSSWFWPFFKERLIELRQWRQSSVFAWELAQSFRSFHWPWTKDQKQQHCFLLGWCTYFFIFLVKFSLTIYFDYLTSVYFWSEKIDVFGKFLLSFTYNLPLWRSIVTCNRCNIVSSHKCLTYTNQTFCTMSFNRKLIKFGGKIFRNWEAMFVLTVLRGRPADFKARAMLMLRLRTANLL